MAATRRFFTRALEHRPAPTEVTTDRAPAYPRVLEELFPAACHVTEQYANNAVEADHGRLKARLRPMRGLKRLGSMALRVIQYWCDPTARDRVLAGQGFEDWTGCWIAADSPDGVLMRTPVPPGSW